MISAPNSEKLQRVGERSTLFFNKLIVILTAARLLPKRLGRVREPVVAQVSPVFVTSGNSASLLFDPRLTPWAAFCRFAAGAWSGCRILSIGRNYAIEFM